MTTQSECEYCNGEGGEYDEESQDQFYWCEYCDALEQFLKRNPSPKAKPKDNYKIIKILKGDS